MKITCRTPVSKQQEHLDCPTSDLYEGTIRSNSSGYIRNFVPVSCDGNQPLGLEVKTSSQVVPLRETAATAAAVEWESN